MIYLLLFFTFFKIGAFTFGGGYAMLPLVQDEVARHGWMTIEELVNFIAVSESTPGPIGINMATYVGYTVGGIPGAVLATLGTILPGVILVLILARFLQKYRDNRYINAAFYGLRPASTALIAAAGVSVLGESLFNVSLYRQTGSIADLFSWGPIILAAVLAVLTNIKPTKDIHPVVYIAASAVVGIVFGLGGA